MEGDWEKGEKPREGSAGELHIRSSPPPKSKLGHQLTQIVTNTKLTTQFFLLNNEQLYFRLEDVQGVSEQELRSNPAFSLHFLNPREEDGEEGEKEKDDLIRVEFTVGCGTTAVDRRLETALTTFLEGERSRLTLRVFIEPKFNSREGGEPLWVTVVATVHLVNLVQAEPLWRWFPETRSV